MKFLFKHKVKKIFSLIIFSSLILLIFLDKTYISTDSKIFDFLVNIALSSNPSDVDSIDLIKSLCVAALTA